MMMVDNESVQQFPAMVENIKAEKVIVCMVNSHPDILDAQQKQIMKTLSNADVSPFKSWDDLTTRLSCFTAYHKAHQAMTAEETKKVINEQVQKAADLWTRLNALDTKFVAMAREQGQHPVGREVSLKILTLESEAVQVIGERTKRALQEKQKNNAQ